MPTFLRCPHCGKDVEIAEALKQQVEDRVAKETEAKVRRELEEKSITEVKELKILLEEKEKKLSEAQNLELEARRMKNALEEEKRSFELKLQREIDAERNNIRQKTLEEAMSEHKLKDREKEKVIEDLKKALEDAQRKASQTSQQLQGEVQELDLEETLKAAFVTDSFEAVEKGVRGADFRQIVKTPRGNACGVILWESKRTKIWSDGWISKLKEDLRAEKANIPIIVSSVLPKEITGGFGRLNGVWICGYPLIIPVSEALRQGLIEVAREKFYAQNKGEKAELIYHYVTSHEFQQQIEAIVEVYKEMNDQILKEKAAFERIWKTRESQAHRLLNSTARVVGSIQGNIGITLPQIKGLDLLTEGKDE